MPEASCLPLEVRNRENAKATNLMSGCLTAKKTLVDPELKLARREG